MLREWERWSADLLETHLSYPVIAYFRSQHDNQSWVAALAMMGGLIAATILTLTFLPALYALAFKVAVPVRGGTRSIDGRHQEPTEGRTLKTAA